jgi:hypothetical protein
VQVVIQIIRAYRSTVTSDMDHPGVSRDLS